jgi:hypothetical protein
MTKLAEMLAEIDAKRKQVHDLFALHDDVADLTPEEAGQVKALNDELGDLGKKQDELAVLERARDFNDEAITRSKVPGTSVRHAGGDPNDPGNGGGGYNPMTGKSLGRLFAESVAVKDFDPTQKKGPTAEFPISALRNPYSHLKSVLGTDDSLADVDTQFAIENLRTGLILPGVLKPPVVADLFPSGTTVGNSIVYMEETTTTAAAAETAEGAAKPESAIDFTEQTSPVRNIATVLPVTIMLMEDAPALESYVNNRLRTFVEDREDTQLLVGNGVAPNLEGILNVSGINTQAKGADSAPDAVYKGIVKCQTTSFLQPDSAVFNPLDWQDIRLLQTADGIYIFGPPSAPGPDRIWGLPVTLTTALTENTGLVGAFRASSQIFRRTGITLAVSDSHSDFFIKNKLMLRAEERIALVVFRPTGFCEVTGI